MEDNWKNLKTFVETGAKMNPHECGSGMKKAYINVLKLMNLIESGQDIDDIIFDNGNFYKKQNILEL